MRQVVGSFVDDDHDHQTRPWIGARDAGCRALRVHGRRHREAGQRARLDRPAWRWLVSRHSADDLRSADQANASELHSRDAHRSRRHFDSSRQVRTSPVTTTPPQRVLLTGATGFIGSHLLRTLAADGSEVHCLARANGPESAACRVRRAVDLADVPLAHERNDWFVHEGDLGAINPDAVAGTLRRHGAFDAVWHCAASTDLVCDDPAQLQRANVDATRIVLRLAQQLGVPRFHHVSTAYQCGETQTAVPEARVPQPARFRNAYEHSKWCAEELLWREIPDRLTVYRPSIVIGQTDLRRITHWQGFYLYVRQVGRLAAARARQAGSGMQPIAFPGRADTPLDLVCVDDVVSAMHRLSRYPGSRGAAFHLVAPRRWAIGALAREIEALLDGAQIHLSEAPEVAATWHGDRVIDGLMPYLRISPTFETTRTRAMLNACGHVTSSLTEERLVRHLRAALGRTARLAGFAMREAL